MSLDCDVVSTLPGGLYERTKGVVYRRGAL